MDENRYEHNVKRQTTTTTHKTQSKTQVPTEIFKVKSNKRVDVKNKTKEMRKTNITEQINL